MIFLRSSLIILTICSSFYLTACSTPPSNPTSPIVTLPPNPVPPTPVPPTPITPAPTPPAPVLPIASDQYVIQLIASHSNSKAESIKDQLIGQGYGAFVNSAVVNGKLFHRVQIGGFDNKVLAENSLQEMQQKLPGNPHVANAIVKKA